MNRTVRDFQNALWKALEKTSFEHLTIDEICQEALLHRSSFYRYFHDKYDLLEQSVSTILKDLVSQVDDEMELMDVIIDYVEDHKKVFRNLADISSHSALYGEFIKILSDVLMERRESDGLGGPAEGGGPGTPVL